MVTPEPVLSVMMPVYNERSTLKEIVQQVLASPWVGQLVIVDDCSQDGTVELLGDEIAGLDARVDVHFHEVNKGKGAAIQTAREHLSQPFCIIQDADLEYDPSEYGRLLEPLLDGHADVVYGSRFRGDVRRVLFFWHTVGNRFLTLFSNACTNLNLSDMETCYKAFRTELFQSIPLRSQRFGFEPEITAKLARRGVRIYEVPISYHGRTYKEGKKISWKDGFSAVWVITRERLMGGRDLSHVHRTLDSIAPLHRYHRFLWDAVADHAGDRILEAGSGIGNISQFFLQRPHVWLTDVDETFLRNLRSRFESRPNVEVRRLDLTRPLGPDNCEDLRGRADTAVAFNVVEHLEDDLQAFRTLAEALEPGGHLLVVIPAGPALYGALDEELGHIRRYRRADLEAVIAEAGFDIVSTTRANAIGALGWWLNGRLLRRRHIPRFQARFNNLLVPLLRVERALRVPFGLSLVVVARRREDGLTV
ncbi:MAG TPA: bifunctional glycosyltransferase/class I SAM-dependent methyltransferase [Acidobacteriota bacterium]